MPEKQTDSSFWVVVFGAGALLLCCLGPVLLPSGVAALAWMVSAVQPYRVELIAASGLLLGGWLYAARRRRGDCCSRAPSTRETGERPWRSP